MKPNRGALPIEHGTAEVVVHQRARTATKRVEGLDMAAEKTLQRLVQGEERRERPRVRQHHDEARERARAVPDADRSKGAPVDLGLFRHQGIQTAIERAD